MSLLRLLRASWGASRVRTASIGKLTNLKFICSQLCSHYPSLTGSRDEIPCGNLTWCANLWVQVFLLKHLHKILTFHRTLPHHYENHRLPSKIILPQTFFQPGYKSESGYRSQCLIYPQCLSSLRPRPPRWHNLTTTIWCATSLTPTRTARSGKGTRDSSGYSGTLFLFFSSILS